MNTLADGHHHCAACGEKCYCTGGNPAYKGICSHCRPKENLTRIGPARGIEPNFELVVTPWMIRFKLLDPKAERIGMPCYLLNYLIPWQKRDLPYLIADELRKHGLSGTWSPRKDPVGYDLYLQPAHGARAGMLLGLGLV